MLIAGDDVLLIDWTPVRLAQYWYDLGVTMHHIYYQPPTMRQALLDSYVTTRPTTVDARLIVEAMLTYAALDNLAWNSTIAAQRASPLFQKNLAQLFDHFCAALLAERSFLFDA